MDRSFLFQVWSGTCHLDVVSLSGCGVPQVYTISITVSIFD